MSSAGPYIAYPGPPPEDGGGTPPAAPLWKPPTGVPDPNMTEAQLRASPQYQAAISWGASEADALIIAAYYIGNQAEQGNNYLTNQTYWLNSHKGYKEGFTNGMWTSPGDYNAKRQQYWNRYKVAHPEVSDTYDPNDAGFATLFGTAATAGWSIDDFDRHVAGPTGFTYTSSPDAVKKYFTPGEAALIQGYEAGTINTPEAKALWNKMQWYNEGYGIYAEYGQGVPTRAQLDADYQQYGTNAGSSLRHKFGKAESKADDTSAQDQAARDAKQEADRRARIETAAQRIEAGFDPSIAALFTKEELHNAAIWQAGGEWGDAKAAREIDLASPVNQYFMHFYGRGVTRQEVDQYYASGATPEYVNQTLDSLGIQRAFPTNLATMFTPEEIKMYSDEKAGIHTAQGKHIADLVDAAQQFNPIYQQYQGRPATRAEIEGHLAAGDTAQSVTGRFGGASWMEANRPDVQYVAGAFGEGQLTPEQQTALGQTQAGYATPMGMKLQTMFDKATERARTSFQGTLAHIERTTPFASQGSNLPDIGA